MRLLTAVWKQHRVLLVSALTLQIAIVCTAFAQVTQQANSTDRTRANDDSNAGVTASTLEEVTVTATRVQRSGDFTCRLRRRS